MNTPADTPLRHLLEIDDLAAGELHRILDLAAPTAGSGGGAGADVGIGADAGGLLAGRTVALYFAKPSLRTRHSSEAAVVHLGGHPLTFTDREVSVGAREPAGDVAQVLSGYHAAVGARVFAQKLLDVLAAGSSVPVINLLSDAGHPCQALADLLTMRQEFGDLSGRTVAWIGDYNNVARSLTLGATMAGMHVRLATPPGYGPDDAELDRIAGLGGTGSLTVTARATDAAEGADAVHTDVWASMGQEEEADTRRRAFEGFQVDDRVMDAAAPAAVFMHCLPAHRGDEVTASVADGHRSRMFPQAHNRMHAMIGLFRWLAEVGSL